MKSKLFALSLLMIAILLGGITPVYATITPVEVIPGCVRYDYVWNNTAFIGQGPTMKVFDIAPGVNLSNMNQTSYFGNYTFSTGSITGFAVSGNILYITAGNSFFTFTLSNRLYPEYLARLDTGISLDDVRIVNGYAYTGGSGLVVINVVDPANPFYVKYIAKTPSSCTSDTYDRLTDDGNYLYGGFLKQRVISIWDISTPGNPVFTSNITYVPYSTDACYGTTGIGIKGDSLYVANYYNRVIGINVADRSNPVQFNNGSSYSGQSIDIAISGNYMFVSQRYQGMHVFDITNPNPIKVGDYTKNTGYTSQLATNGNVTVMTKDTSGVDIFDTSVKTSPTWKSTLSVGSEAYVMQLVNISGKPYLEYAGRNRGNWYFNLSNPTIPSKGPIFSWDLGIPGVGPRSFAIATEGNYTFSLSGSSGAGIGPLFTQNLTGMTEYSDPWNHNPEFSEWGTYPYNYAGIMTNASRLYAWNYLTPAVFEIWDISTNPMNPTMISSTPRNTTTGIGKMGNNVDSDGATAFFYNSQYIIGPHDKAGLQVLDISDESYPHVVNTYDTGYQYLDLAYNSTSKQVYVVYYSGTYHVKQLDLTDVFNIQQVGTTFDFGSGISSPRNIQRNGTDIFVVGGGNPSLYQFDYSNPYKPVKVDVESYSGSDSLLFYQDLIGGTGDYLYTGGKDSMKVYSVTPSSLRAINLPISNFTANPISGAAPLTVLFTSTSVDTSPDNTTSGVPKGFLWSFGDNQTSGANPVSHTYPSIGTYNASLRVTGEEGIDYSDNQTITVQATGADFIANVTWNATAPLTVSFTRIPTDAPEADSYEWNFVDGNATVDATTKDAVYTYTQPGRYTVRYQVTDGGEVANKTRPFYIVIGGDTCQQEVGITAVNSGSPYISGNNTFEGLRTATSSNSASTGSWITSWISSSGVNSTGFFDLIYRGRADWNTSGYTNITSAKIGVTYYYSGLHQFPTPNFTFIDASPANPMSYSVNDWDNTLFRRVTEDKRITLSSSSGGDQFNFTVTNLSYLNPNGITSVFFVTNWDADNTPPTWTANTDTWAEFYKHSSSTASYRPKLYIGHTDICNTNPLLPKADFSVNDSYGIETLATQFYDSSFGNPTSWNWSFGDGNYSTAQNPSHLYVGIGEYTANLTVTNAIGSSSKAMGLIVQETVPVETAPVADFSCAPLVGDNPVDITCTDLSTNSPTGWNWAFGDGSGSTYRTPTHTYTAEGLYNVSLEASNGAGNDTLTKIGYIDVRANGTSVYTPVPAFTCSPLSGTAPLGTTCVDESTNVPSQWLWEFESASGIYDAYTDQNPSVELNYPGAWNVTLTVGNSAGSATLAKPNYITADLGSPFTDFTATPTYGSSPLSVQFTDLSIFLPSSWEWYWFANETISSTSQNPTANFTEGTYDVRLRVTNFAGSTWSNKSAFIVVYSIDPPVTDFTADVTSGIKPLTVHFTDSSTNIPTAWNWSFGGSNYSVSQNPSHVFTESGVYTISLNSSNAYGSDIRTRTNYITVNNPPAPTAGFSVNTTTICMNSTIQFTDTSTGTPTSWYWEFGEGNTSTTHNPAFRYPNEGSYGIKFKATNTYGDSWLNTSSNFITVQNCTGTTVQANRLALAGGTVQGSLGLLAIAPLALGAILIFLAFKSKGERSGLLLMLGVASVIAGIIMIIVALMIVGGLSTMVTV